MKKIVVAVPILILILIPLVLFLLSVAPSVQIDPALHVLGTETPVKVQVRAGHATRRVTAYIEQNNQRYRVFESTQPRRASGSGTIPGHR